MFQREDQFSIAATTLVVTNGRDDLAENIVVQIAAKAPIFIIDVVGYEDAEYRERDGTYSRLGARGRSFGDERDRIHLRVPRLPPGLNVTFQVRTAVDNYGDSPPAKTRQLPLPEIVVFDDRGPAFQSVAKD